MLNNLSSLSSMSLTSTKGIFSPSNISSLKLWFDANKSIFSDAGTTPCVNGSVVQQWTDLSSSGKNLTAAGAARPLYSVINGKPYVVFNDGSANHVANYLQTSGASLVQPEHIFIVFKQNTWVNNSYIFDGDTTNGNKMTLYQNGTTPTIKMYVGGVGPTTAALAVDTFGIVDTLFAGASSKLHVNGANEATGSIATDAGGDIRIGAYGGGVGAYSYITVGEVIIYSAAISGGDYTNLINYLVSKWGIIL